MYLKSSQSLSSSIVYIQFSPRLNACLGIYLERIVWFLNDVHELSDVANPIVALE